MRLVPWARKFVSVWKSRTFLSKNCASLGRPEVPVPHVESKKFGDITVELFDVDAARECDVVFLAVSGDFALEHAEAICAGDDGAVVIDNSVSFCFCCVTIRSDLVCL